MQGQADVLSLDMHYFMFVYNKSENFGHGLTVQAACIHLDGHTLRRRVCDDIGRYTKLQSGWTAEQLHVLR